jgi:ornithine cyclodeaminase/alanine dehydrogenase-like protein (mu-crystallin family)
VKEINNNMGSILGCFEADLETKVRTAIVTPAVVAGVMVEAHAKYLPPPRDGANTLSRV